MDFFGRKSFGESSQASNKAKSEKEKARAAIQLLSTFPLKSLFNLASYPNPHQELARIAISEASGSSMSSTATELQGQPSSSTRPTLARAPDSPTPSPRSHHETMLSSEDELQVRDSRDLDDQTGHEYIPNTGFSWADDQDDYTGSDKGKGIASESFFIETRKLPPGISSLRPEAKPFMTMKGTKSFREMFPSKNFSKFVLEPTPNDGENPPSDRDSHRSVSPSVPEDENTSEPPSHHELDHSLTGLPPAQLAQCQNRANSMPEMTSARTWAEKARLGHLSSLSQARPMVAFKKNGKGHIHDLISSSSSGAAGYSSIETFRSSYQTTDSCHYNSSSEVDEMATTSGLEQQKKPTLFPGTMSGSAQNVANGDFVVAAAIERSSSTSSLPVEPPATQPSPLPSHVATSPKYSNDVAVGSAFAENPLFVQTCSSVSSGSSSGVEYDESMPPVSSDSRPNILQPTSRSDLLPQDSPDSELQVANSSSAQAQQMLPYATQHAGHGAGPTHGPSRGYLNMPPGIHHPSTTLQSHVKNASSLSGHSQMQQQMSVSAQASQQLSQHQFSHQDMMHQHQQNMAHIHHHSHQMAQNYQQHHHLQQFHQHQQILSQKYYSAFQNRHGDLGFAYPEGPRMYFPHNMDACDGPFCQYCGFEEDDPDSAQNSQYMNPGNQYPQVPVMPHFFNSGSQFPTAGGAAMMMAASGSSSISALGLLSNGHSSSSTVPSQHIYLLGSASREVSDSRGILPGSNDLPDAENDTVSGNWYYPIPSADWPAGIGIRATEKQKRGLADRAYPLDMTYPEIAVVEECKETAKTGWKAREAQNLQEDLYAIRQKIQKLDVAREPLEPATGPELNLAEAPLPLGLEESLEDSWNAYEKRRLADMGLEPKKTSDTKQPFVPDPQITSKIHPLVAEYPDLRPIPAVADATDNRYSILTDLQQVASMDDGTWGPMPTPRSRFFMPARKSESPQNQSTHPFGAVGQEFDKLKRDCNNPNGLMAALAQKQYRDFTAKVQEQKKELGETGYERLGSSALLEDSVSDDN